MTENVASDVGPETPTWTDESAELIVHFVLNGVPGDIMPHDSSQETPDGKIPFASINISHNVTAEEARTIMQLMPFARAIIAQAKQGDRKPHVYPLIISQPPKEV
jgi:hypothetical protein